MTVTVTSALAGPATARYSNVYGALVDLGVLSGLGAQDVTGSGDPVAPILNAAGFYAPLTHSLVLTRGTGDPTFTRATSAWEFDNEGKLIFVPSGAARFGGARMVRNLLTYSEDFSNAVWGVSLDVTKTSTNNTSPIGTATALLLTNANTTAVHNTYHATNITPVLGRYTYSVYLKAGGTNRFQLTFGATDWGTSQYANYSLSGAGAILASSGGTATIESVGGGWYRCSWSAVATATSSAVPVGMGFINSDTATRFPSFLGSVLESVYIWGAQLENVTGQADQTASEYVSTNVLSAPYHGAGTDGVKYFNTNKDGSAIPASTLLGNHAEGARTNSLLWARDLTNAAWAKTNITAAKTVTGIDNAANSASTITAGAADATILQTLTLAAAARSFSAYVKRRTGSGNIYITRDGGTNWTDVTSQINSTTWTRVKIENTSVLNPQVGFKIATSGDAIDVDVCQDEAWAFISSPIITTTSAVTRNAELLDYATTNVSANSTFAGTWYTPTLANSAIQPIIGTKTNSIEGFGKEPTTNKLYISNPADATTVTGSAITVNTFNKFAGTLNGTTRSVSSNGGAATSAADANPWTATKLRMNGDGWGSQSKGYLKDVYIWSTALTDAQLQQVTS